MPSTLFLTRTRHVALLLAVAMAWHDATAATEMTKIRCRGTTIQNACKQQEICINDLRRLPKDFILSLYLKSQTYTMHDVTGRIVAVDDSHADRHDLRIDPAIQGGTQLEMSPDGKKARLVGGDYNYFFECRNAGR